MLKFLWNMLPKDYKWSIGIKKASQAAGKFAAGLLVGSAIGQKLSPDHVKAVEAVIATLAMAGLEWGHDWAKLKWKDKEWAQKWL